MKFAIIGSGAIGSALAAQFARSGISVLVANSRGPASLVGLAQKLGPSIKPASVEDALRQDIVILAVPFVAVAETAREMSPWNNRIVVDATNAISFPKFEPIDLGGRRSTDVVAELFPGARVVKAFNTLPAALLASPPSEQGGRRVIFMSGDDRSANSDVANLVEKLGFAPIVLGTLSAAAPMQEFGGSLMVHNLIKMS